MSEDKKQSDEKKYAQISREFVRHCGDAIGLPSVSTDICVLLAEDVNYRLREAVQTSGQFMRHAKRKKLSNDDFNKALRCSDVEPVFGHSSSEGLPFVYVKDAEVFCTEDHEINLVLMASARHAYENPGLPTVRAQWLVVEGVPKGNPSSNNGKKNTSSVAPVISDDLMSYYNQVTKAILGNDEEVTKTALDDLKTNSKIAPLLPLFINFVSVGVKKVSHDLTQLTKLLHTVQSLTNNHYLYLGPRPFLKLLLHGVLYCIVEPLAASLNPINDHWALRDYAARLLANIIRLWHTPVNRLYDEALSALQDVFTDPKKPFSSHYGAVMALMALGIEPVWKCLYQNMANYWPHLIYTLEDKSITNVPFKSDAQKVYGALLLAAEFLLLSFHRAIATDERCTDESTWTPTSDGFSNTPTSRSCSGAESSAPGVAVKQECKSESPGTHSVKQELGEPSERTHPPDEKPVGSSMAELEQNPRLMRQVYDQLYDYFGDALAARLPFVPVENFYAPRTTSLVSLFTTPELMQTGEELLEAFNVKEDEVQSTSMEDDHYSYEDHDDNSLMSDDGEQADVDLRIKSTVSDPIQGIKLTITKLPRTQPVTSEPAKLTKLSIKISKEQLLQPEPEPPPPPPAPPLKEQEGPFELLPFRPRCMYIEFNFEGSMPIPSHQLKRKHPGGHPFYQRPIATEVHALGLKMKTVRKSVAFRRTLRVKRFVRSFRTGNLLSMI